MPRSAVSRARFLLDPCEFQKHQLCRRLWQKQREILRSVYENPLTAVKGCHASGKTFAAAGLPLSWLVRYKTGKRPAEVLADGGYCSEKNLTALESAEDPSRRVEGYIATERQKHDEYKEVCPRGPLPKDATRVDRMRRRLKTRAGRAVYAARKTIVEPVFGQIKHARGFRQFLLRGIDKVRAEWSLVCLTHNVLKLYRLCYQ